MVASPREHHGTARHSMHFTPKGTGVNGPAPTTSLARRIATWSGNLLATGAIVILGLTFGKQVLQWWHGDPPVVAVEQQTMDNDLRGFANPQLPHLLAFGDLPVAMDRTVIEGNEAAALAHLRARCRAIATTASQHPAQRIPASESLLRRLEQFQPVEQGKDWRIVQSAGPVITVVALRMACDTSTEPAAVTSQHGTSVLSWGIGLRQPASAKSGTTATAATEPAAAATKTARLPERWTLFTCSGIGKRVDSDLDTALPIPPGCRRTMSVRGSGGGMLIGFSGAGTAATAMPFYDRSLVQLGWRRTRPWRQMGALWHARFERSSVTVCDIQIADNSEREHGVSDSSTNGILTITSAARNSEN